MSTKCVYMLEGPLLMRPMCVARVRFTAHIHVVRMRACGGCGV